MSPIPVESENLSTGEVHYGPANVRVKGTSQYNANQISFEGIPGFWELPKSLQDKGAPEPGTVLQVWLKTKLKRSANAKPGSKYMDIVTVTKPNPNLDLTTDGLEHTDGSEPYEPPRDAYREPQVAQPSTKQDYWADKDIAIKKAQAVNLWVNLLTGMNKWLEKALTDRGHSPDHILDRVLEAIADLEDGRVPFMEYDVVEADDGTNIPNPPDDFIVDADEEPPVEMNEDPTPW